MLPVFPHEVLEVQAEKGDISGHGDQLIHLIAEQRPREFLESGECEVIFSVKGVLAFSVIFFDLSIWVDFRVTIPMGGLVSFVILR